MIQAARLAPALRRRLLRSVTSPASSLRSVVAAVRWSRAPWAAACARRIGRGTRRSASPRRRRRSCASLRSAASRRRPPSQPHGDPAAPGWHRARLNLAQPAALTLAARREGRRALSLRSASGSRSFASATSRSAGSAWPGARGARALAPACRGGSKKGQVMWVVLGRRFSKSMPKPDGLPPNDAPFAMPATTSGW